MDLNGQKNTQTEKNCPLVPLFLSVSPILFLFQAGTFFAAFLGGPRHFFSGHLPVCKLLFFPFKLLSASSVALGVNNNNDDEPLYLYAAIIYEPKLRRLQ